jgi:transcriptional regulator with XRE-family HTH domain
MGGAIMNDHFYRAMGRRLKITRLALNLSEAEAAAASGMTLRTYQKWEADGHPKGRNAKLLAFCEKYDVSIDWLYFGDAFRAKKNLTSYSPGKVAILPVITVKQLRAKAKAEAFWKNRAGVQS